MDGSLLSSTWNTRFVPGCENRLLRSDAVLSVTDGEAAWLRSLGLSLVIDLRSEKEAAILPCALCGCPSFDVFRISRTSHGGTSLENYLGMLDGSMQEVLGMLERSRGPALYFCQEGCDRTGVVTALMQLRRKVPDEIILQDDLLSFRHKPKQRAEAAGQAMRGFLREMHENARYRRFSCAAGEKVVY